MRKYIKFHTAKRDKKKVYIWNVFLLDGRVIYYDEKLKRFVTTNNSFKIPDIIWLILLIILMIILFNC